MRVFFDTSALAKRFVLEPGSKKVDRICEDADQLAVSLLCVPEMISALNRLVREGELSDNHYDRMKERFETELEDIWIIDLTEKVIQRSVLLLEQFETRTLDALHLACALEWKPDRFVTSDEQQAKIAQHTGLRVQQPHLNG